MADQADRGALAEVLAVHNHQFGSNEIRLWSYCRCTPNVELSGVDDLRPEYGSPFYAEGVHAFRAHLADAIRASTWLAEHDRQVAAEAVEKVARAWQYGGWTILTEQPPPGAIPALASGQLVTDWLRNQAALAAEEEKEA